jgi:hypothetical protein
MWGLEQADNDGWSILSWGNMQSAWGWDDGWMAMDNSYGSAAEMGVYTNGLQCVGSTVSAVAAAAMLPESGGLSMLIVGGATLQVMGSCAAFGSALYDYYGGW